MLGHGSVGKSSLLLRYADQQWLPEHETIATIGVDTWVNTSNQHSNTGYDLLGPQSDRIDVKGRRVNLTVWVRPPCAI